VLSQKPGPTASPNQGQPAAVPRQRHKACRRAGPHHAPSRLQAGTSRWRRPQAALLPHCRRVIQQPMWRSSRHVSPREVGEKFDG
jgi:hypothetical protein